MKNLSVYLTFDCNCEEALNFYKTILNGNIKSLQRFGEALPSETHPLEEKDKNRVMHAEFEAEGIYFMASDGMPGQPVQGGNNVTLNINLTDENEQTEIFNKLAEGGQIGMPLEDAFWGARFGLLTDKYNINWMLNCNKDQGQKAS